MTLAAPDAGELFPDEPPFADAAASVVTGVGGETGCPCFEAQPRVRWRCCCEAVTRGILAGFCFGRRNGLFTVAGRRQGVASPSPFASTPPG